MNSRGCQAAATDLTINIHTMKEIAVTGINGHVLADVLTSLLHNGITVNAYVNEPMRLMDTSAQLTVGLLRADDKEELRRSFEGYHDVVMTFDDNQLNHDENSFVLDHYYEMINAAHEAGVARVVVVGSPQSEAFFTNNLKRRSDIDWVFISTEGDYATRVVEEVVNPKFHSEVFMDN